MFCNPDAFPCESTVASLESQLTARLWRSHEANIAQFDDIETENGWGEVTTNYSFLDFDGLLAFKPTDPELDGLISGKDLNCATSSPNALYGTRYIYDSGTEKKATKLPYIALSPAANASAGEPTSFQLRTLKIKPLDMPFAYTTLSVRGHRPKKETLEWAVDFPAGFHEMLHLHIEAFSGHSWSGLNKLELWADFHNGDMVLDWEFCLDDVELEFEID